ncbi:hypothetical protein HMPREF3214_00739 [Alloscardovia omnicolens]|uniref:Uncharacterized protein n=1 Tax=Alloscardovia omnicolens F0580 TaxID=1321816 RepID=U1RA32_9BIFI|nr:hypothetical protein HMPREF9244_00804 [Alloscardovia omnicolens F0580]KWZ74626.1 hypothetical protein HMPREF3214_00739 [Alloscardovia omnicolens]
MHAYFVRCLALHSHILAVLRAALPSHLPTDLSTALRTDR